MTIDASTYEIIRNLAFAVVVGAVHAYGSMQRQKIEKTVAKTAALVNLTYGDVKGELDTIRASVETLTVKLNGGDRRSASRAAVTDNLDAAHRRRWSDPTTPRPAPPA